MKNYDAEMNIQLYSSKHLNNYKSCFKFILILARGINLNPRLFKVIVDNMWDDLSFCNCDSSIDLTDCQTSLDMEIGE